MTDPLPVLPAYQVWAATYDTDANATRDLDAAVLRATPLPLTGATVAEFGAGTGKNTFWLAEQARQVVAMDFSLAMLAVARARIHRPNVRFVEHDITRPWPLADGSIDIAVGNLVLEHIADLEPVMAAAHRALRPGGTLVLSELHPYRQLRGAGAKLDDARRIEVHVHATSDYVNAAIAAGFALRRMADIPDAGADATALPRLLQLVFQA